MSTKILKGSIELGNKIRGRRNELSLTIEEAAKKAGVGTKTWSRYELGESIRKDKIIGVCKALNWNTLPLQEDSSGFDIDINEYKKSKLWSNDLADRFGNEAAISFIIGSDILLDNIEQDLEALSSKPKGTHIGELDASWLDESLPEQFKMFYDYDFIYYLKMVVVSYRNKAASGECFIAHSVVEELVLYLIMEESQFLMENILPRIQMNEKKKYEDWDEWPFDIFDDMDIITFLYSDFYLEEGHTYHFSNWKKKQFYCK